MPTDTVYGLGCDAFSPEAVAFPLAAKDAAATCRCRFWSGRYRRSAASPCKPVAWSATWWRHSGRAGLTLVCRQQPSLHWDLGDAGGTVAVRMPLHPVAIEVLREHRPDGREQRQLIGAAAGKRPGEQARDQLGDVVAVYLDSDATDDDVPSTIVDVTGPVPRVLRAGAVSST